MSARHAQTLDQRVSTKGNNTRGKYWKRKGKVKEEQKPVLFEMKEINSAALINCKRGRGREGEDEIEGRRQQANEKPEKTRERE
jgi:hypothetical protein